MKQQIVIISMIALGIIHTFTSVHAGEFEFHSENAPMAIDGSEIHISEMWISKQLKIADLNIIIDITHTFTDDLSVFLLGPDGTLVELFTNVGNGGNDFLTTIFDDEASELITSGSAPFTGTYRPEGDLFGFDGIMTKGRWSLLIYDRIGGIDDGALNSWSLDISIAPTHEFNCINAPFTIMDGAVEKNLII